jgi:hypothetical protein
MTAENCLKLLKIYEQKMKDESLPSRIRVQSKKNYDNMKAHIQKYRPNLTIPQAEVAPEKPAEPKEKPKVNQHGKKSKR